MRSTSGSAGRSGGAELGIQHAALECRGPRRGGRGSPWPRPRRGGESRPWRGALARRDFTSRRPETFVHVQCSMDAQDMRMTRNPVEQAADARPGGTRRCVPRRMKSGLNSSTEHDPKGTPKGEVSKSPNGDGPGEQKPGQHHEGRTDLQEDQVAKQHTTNPLDARVGRGPSSQQRPGLLAGPFPPLVNHVADEQPEQDGGQNCQEEFHGGQCSTSLRRGSNGCSRRR